MILMLKVHPKILLAPFKGVFVSKVDIVTFLIKLFLFLVNILIKHLY